VKRALLLLLLGQAAWAQLRVISQPSKSPLVTFRIVMTVGSEADPPDKPGLAWLTAMLLADGGSRELTNQQIADAMFPMAASFDAQVDHEMSTFQGTTHSDNLPAYYKLIRGMLLDPGWREDDFRRVRDDALDNLKVSLRGTNDEELAKEVLYANIFHDTPYGHYPGGSASGLEKITLDDVKQFYRTQYTQSNLILGMAGGFSEAFLDGVKRDFRHLPETATLRPRPKAPAHIDGTRVILVQKETRSVAISIGFPIDVTRRHVDYPALLLAASYLGQHRIGGLLYDELREKRGLNYGDYAYIEYFPHGMFLTEPPPNLARQHQIFQLWIRPVEPRNAVFATRLALYELNRLIEKGMSESDFQRSRDFLMKYVNLLTRTKSAELGYAIDSAFFLMPNYNQYLHEALAKLTRADVNRVIQGYLRTDRLVIAAVAKDAKGLKQQLTSGDPSPVSYNSPRPEEVIAKDRIVEKWPLHLRPDDITVVPAAKVFE